MLTRESILASEDLKREEIKVPEWGGSVYVRTMTAGERDEFEIAHSLNPEKDVRARLAVATVCDADGVLLFTPADIAKLTRKSAAPLDRIFARAMKLNRISAADIEELKGN